MIDLDQPLKLPGRARLKKGGPWIKVNFIFDLSNIAGTVDAYTLDGVKIEELWDFVVGEDSESANAIVIIATDLE